MAFLNMLASDGIRPNQHFWVWAYFTKKFGIRKIEELAIGPSKWDEHFFLNLRGKTHSIYSGGPIVIAADCDLTGMGMIVDNVGSRNRSDYNFSIGALKDGQGVLEPDDNTKFFDVTLGRGKNAFKKPSSPIPFSRGDIFEFRMRPRWGEDSRGRTPVGFFKKLIVIAWFSTRDLQNEENDI